MKALAYWQAVTNDRSDFLGEIVALLREEGIRYCVVGGVGVNAYAEAVITLDLDIAVATDDIERVRTLLTERYRTETFAHSINASTPGSDLRVQVQTDPRYAAFVPRAVERDVLGLTLPVAAVEDILQGKLWALGDPSRRRSKRIKDHADIERLVEVFPELRSRVPKEILDRPV